MSKLTYIYSLLNAVIHQTLNLNTCYVSGVVGHKDGLRSLLCLDGAPG